MTTNVLTIFDQGQMPAHIADLPIESNITGRDTVDQLSFRGKVWRVIVDGNEEVCKNNEGDPVQSVQMVILDYTKTRSRAYYPGNYIEGQSSAPVCWSKDGKLPDAAVTEKQHATCEGCPQSVKGSKVIEGANGVASKSAACAQFKRLAAVPIMDTAFKPLLVKIPQTSMWDANNKENEAKGFYAFDQYMDYLKRKGVKGTAQVVTKMKFDPRASYPKLLFGAHSWLPASETANIMAQLAAREKLDEILNVEAAALSRDADIPAAPDEYEAPAVVKPAPPAPTAPVAAAAPPAPAPVKAPPKPRPVVVAKPVAPVVAPADDDPDDNMVIPGTVVATSAPARPAVVAAAPAAVVSDEPAGKGLSALLTSWDDD
jgi:hypothetical protein